jgi:hypothetical protein
LTALPPARDSKTMAHDIPSRHRCPSHIIMAAHRLADEGILSAYDATYAWVCPDCGKPRRTTRVAVAIHSLRTLFGWDIDTEGGHGELASYRLVRKGIMPGTSSISPLRRTETAPEPGEPKVKAPTMADVPPDESVRWCPHCGTKVGKGNVERILVGGWADAICPGPCGIRIVAIPREPKALVPVLSARRTKRSVTW